MNIENQTQIYKKKYMHPGWILMTKFISFLNNYFISKTQFSGY